MLSSWPSCWRWPETASRIFSGKQKGPDLLFQLFCAEEDGQARRDGKDEFREALLLLGQADPPEEAALPEALFDQRRRADQSVRAVRVRAWEGDIDDDPVLDGVVGDDSAGVGQDGVIRGQGGCQIGIEGQPVEARDEEPRHDRRTRRMNDHRSLYWRKDMGTRKPFYGDETSGGFAKEILSPARGREFLTERGRPCQADSTLANDSFWFAKTPRVARFKDFSGYLCRQSVAAATAIV